MRFFPSDTETLRSPYSKSELLGRLDEAMNATDEEDEGEYTGAPNRKQWFIGERKDETFKISLKLKRPNNFTPIISGLVEVEKDGGSVAVVRYDLFPSSRRFLAFWTILTLLITIFFAIPYNAYLYAAISLGACLVNYIITFENFKIQVRKSRRALVKVFRGSDWAVLKKDHADK